MYRVVAALLPEMSIQGGLRHGSDMFSIGESSILGLHISLPSSQQAYCQRMFGSRAASHVSRACPSSGIALRPVGFFGFAGSGVTIAVSEGGPGPYAFVARTWKK